MAGNSLTRGEIRVRIICRPDCLAERETFEPSVQVFSLQRVNVRVSYIGSVRSENSPDCPLASQSMRTKAILVGGESRNISDVLLKEDHFRGPFEIEKWSRSDLTPSAQS